MIKVSATGMVVPLKTDLRFPMPGQWGHGDRIIQSCGGIMIKAIFFDIDGTILSHRIKDVPISTRQALCQLSDIHVDRVIATGRHSTEIDRLPVNDIKFDAYITLNGQLCYDLKGNVFYENPIKETGEILKFFHSSTVPVMLVEKDRMYINFINNDVVQAHEAISTPLPTIMEYTGNTIYQAIFYVKKAEQSKITGCLKNVEITRWNDSAVDVVEKGGSKVTGIQKYLSIKEYTREEAAAFGDGENDIEMLRYVQEGIAMGNANDFVKSIADYVTADIDDNGIEKGLRYLGLL